MDFYKLTAKGYNELYGGEQKIKHKLIKENLDIKNTDFFKAAYNVLLNKDRGPKLAPFILALGKERVVELFEKV